MFKFENVFDDHPKWVNLGSQKNFGRYALRIGKEWEKSSDSFNELYFRRAIARGILFRTTELVSEQPWYNGGYRANIVAYTLSMFAAGAHYPSPRKYRMCISDAGLRWQPPPYGEQRVRRGTAPQDAAPETTARH